MSEKRTFRLDKLVLDGVFDSMKALGQEPDSVQLEGMDLLKALAEKIVEETDELAESQDLKELASVHQAVLSFLSVLENYAKSLGISKEQIEAQLRTRFEEMGDFSGGHKVRTLTLNADDKWCQYYADHPDRFPEITE